MTPYYCTAVSTHPFLNLIATFCFSLFLSSSRPAHMGAGGKKDSEMKKSKKMSQAQLWKEKGLVPGELEPSLGRGLFPAPSQDLRNSLLPRTTCMQMGMRDQYKLVG